MRSPSALNPLLSAWGPGERSPLASPPRSAAADVGLLLLRLTVGLLMAGHGSQKLFGLFGGPGLTETGKQLAAMGYRPGKVYAVIGGCPSCPAASGRPSAC